MQKKITAAKLAAMELAIRHLKGRIRRSINPAIRTALTDTGKIVWEAHPASDRPGHQEFYYVELCAAILEPEIA